MASKSRAYKQHVRCCCCAGWLQEAMTRWSWESLPPWQGQVRICSGLQNLWKNQKNRNISSSAAISDQNHRKNQKKPKKPKFRARCKLASNIPHGVDDSILAQNFGFFGFFWFSQWFYSVISPMAQTFWFFWFFRRFSPVPSSNCRRSRLAQDKRIVGVCSYRH